MKNLKAKLRNQGGFTLVEMLIVVAIIAILIAISIPMVNSSLERSQHAADAANERAAKAAAILQLLNNEIKAPSTGSNVYAYDAKEGKFAAKDDGTPIASGATGYPNDTEYGKHTGHDFLTYTVANTDGTAFNAENLKWNTEGSGTVKKCSDAKDVKHDT